MAGGTHIIRMKKRHAQMKFLLENFTKPVVVVDGMGDMEYDDKGLLSYRNNICID